MEIIDIFKFPIIVSYKEKARFSTLVGSIVSIFIIAAIIFISLFFGQNLYLKLNPSVIIQENSEKVFPSYVFTDDNSVFAYGFFYLNQTQLDKYIFVQAQYTNLME
jgi:hypothetical protein